MVAVVPTCGSACGTPYAGTSRQGLAPDSITASLSSVGYAWAARPCLTAPGTETAANVTQPGSRELMQSIMARLCTVAALVFKHKADGSMYPYNIYLDTQVPI